MTSMRWYACVVVALVIPGPATCSAGTAFALRRPDQAPVRGEPVVRCVGLLGVPPTSASIAVSIRARSASVCPTPRFCSVARRITSSRPSRQNRPPGIRGAAHVRRRRGVGHPGAAAARQRGSRGGTGSSRVPARQSVGDARAHPGRGRHAARTGAIESGVVSATSLASFPPFYCEIFSGSNALTGTAQAFLPCPKKTPSVLGARWWARWAMDGPRRAPARRRSRVGRWRRPRTAATGGVAAGSGA